MPAVPQTRANAIEAADLVKVFPGSRRAPAVRALDGVSLQVPEGSVLGLLGPNGAGKTTAVRVLTTLLRPDSGTARVGGFDVASQSEQVRRVIGVTGQYAAVDENLSGRENLVMFGRLYHLGSATATARADELLEQFRLTDAADRYVKTYSGGMRRRLDLAAGLIASPAILFLDEPTTGLDPRSRLGMWDVIRDLVRAGTTLLLTTQYLEEADELADQIAVIDTGTIIAQGTADELKAQVGGERIEVVVHEEARIADARGILERITSADSVLDAHMRKITAASSGGADRLIEVVREFDATAIRIDDIGVRRPTMDDVFLALTGHRAEQAAEAEPETSTTSGAR